MNKRSLWKSKKLMSMVVPNARACGQSGGSINLEAAFWLLVNVMAAIYGAFVAGLFTGLFLIN